MFMAFLLRDEPFPGWEDRPELLLALVIGSAGLGSTIGIALGSVLRRSGPRSPSWSALLADAAVAVVAAVFYGLPSASLLGLTAGLAQSLGKLSLDALIQREIPERRRPARSPAPRRCSSCPGWSAASSASPCRWSRSSGSASPPRLLVAWTVWVLARRRGARPSALRGLEELELELVGERAEQLRGRLGALRVGVPAGAVALPMPSSSRSGPR